MQIMVEEHGALWLLKIGFDEAFARVSPGNLLLMEVIRHAAANGLERVEFLGKDAPWTAAWPAGQVRKASPGWPMPRPCSRCPWAWSVLPLPWRPCPV